MRCIFIYDKSNDSDDDDRDDEKTFIFKLFLFDEYIVVARAYMTY